MSPVFDKFSKLWQFSYVKESQNLINSEFSNLDIWLNFSIGPNITFSNIGSHKTPLLIPHPQDFVAISDVRAERVKIFSLNNDPAAALIRLFRVSRINQKFC